MMRVSPVLSFGGALRVVVQPVASGVRFIMRDPRGCLRDAAGQIHPAHPCRCRAVPTHSHVGSRTKLPRSTADAGSSASASRSRHPLGARTLGASAHLGDAVRDVKVTPVGGVLIVTGVSARSGDGQQPVVIEGDAVRRGRDEYGSVAARAPEVDLILPCQHLAIAFVQYVTGSTSILHLSLCSADLLIEKGGAELHSAPPFCSNMLAFASAPERIPSCDRAMRGADSAAR